MGSVLPVPRRGGAAEEGGFGPEVEARGAGGVLHGLRLPEPRQGRELENLPGADPSPVPATRFVARWCAGQICTVLRISRHEACSSMRFRWRKMPYGAIQWAASAARLVTSGGVTHRGSNNVGFESAIVLLAGAAAVGFGAHRPLFGFPVVLPAPLWLLVQQVETVAPYRDVCGARLPEKEALS